MPTFEHGASRTPSKSPAISPRPTAPAPSSRFVRQRVGHACSPLDPRSDASKRTPSAPAEPAAAAHVGQGRVLQHQVWRVQRCPGIPESRAGRPAPAACAVPVGDPVVGQHAHAASLAADARRHLRHGQDRRCEYADGDRWLRGLAPPRSQRGFARMPRARRGQSRRPRRRRTHPMRAALG